MKRLLLLVLPLLLASAIVFLFLNRPASKSSALAVRPAEPQTQAPPAADTTCSFNPMPAENPDGARPNQPVAQREGTARPLPEWAAVLDNYTEAELDPRRESSIESRQGTRITMPPYALQLPDGTVPDGPVKITVQEFYTPAAIALAGLSTQSRGRLLESGGMVYVDASYKGQPLRLRRNATYDLDMPYSTKKPDMQLFAGEAYDGRIDWDLLASVEEQRQAFYRQPFVRPAAFDSLQTLLRNSLQWPQDVEGTNTWWEATIHFNISAEGKPERLFVDNPMSPGFTEMLDSILRARPLRPVGWADGKPAAAAFSQHLTFRWPTEQPNARNFRVERSTLFVDSVYGKGEAGYYTFRSPTLGWINCDRFYNDPRARENLYVKSSDPNVDMTLVFHSMNSMMRGRRTDSGFVFDNLPKGEEVTVIAMKKEGKCYELGMRKRRVGDGTVRDMYLEPMSMATAHQRLLALNNKKPATGASANSQTTQP